MIPTGDGDDFVNVKRDGNMILVSHMTFDEHRDPRMTRNFDFPCDEWDEIACAVRNLIHGKQEQQP